MYAHMILVITAIMFDKVSRHTQSANIKELFQVWRESSVVNSTHYSCKYSFHQPILFQFKDTLIHIIDPLALTSLSTTLQSCPQLKLF